MNAIQAQDASLLVEARDITQHEIRALRQTYNLADAHTHQKQSCTQQQIVASLPQLWYSAERRKQAELERAFTESFFTLHNQLSLLHRSEGVYLTYAASISTVIAAMYLRSTNRRVGLIEPCFDNLHDLLKNTGIRMESIPESVFIHEDQIYENLARYSAGVDAIFLVDPNNPTGFSIMAGGRRGLEEVIRFCGDHEKLLILDLSFAAFSVMDPLIGRFDIYEMLDDSNVSYISIEDTGKTWPLQDAKCSVLVTSYDIADQVYDFHTSVLLNVSPFVLNIVREYVEDSRRDGFASVRDIITDNRSLVRAALDSPLLEYCEPRVNTSVAWFRITDPGIASSRLHNDVLRQEVYVLPGKYFYWHHRQEGERFIRIALARESGLVREAMSRLRRVVDAYEQ
jgi:aspartate/methionine/tyrosine aminotransferase